MYVKWDFGWGSLTFLPSYSESYNHNVDSHLAGISHSTSPNSVDALGDGQINSRKQTTGELRLSSPAESDFIWVVGAYYMKTEDYRYYFIGPPVLDSGLLHYNQDVTSATYVTPLYMRMVTATRTSGVTVSFKY